MLLLTHPDCLDHEVPARHPEHPSRLRAVLEQLTHSGLAAELTPRTATPVSLERIRRVHRRPYLEALEALAPAEGYAFLDPDTVLSPRSLFAARAAAGAVVDAVEAVLNGNEQRAFCAVRPPGHHAEADGGMGFCFYNSIAIGADTAMAEHGLSRVAILDFDVHHGNGTVDIFKDRPEVLVCSSFQHPHYPNRLFDLDRPNIVNTPLPAGTDGAAFRAAIERDWVAAVRRHRPELILVSAGFDGHGRDPLSDWRLTADDYTWITRLIVALAQETADGRIVSTLEGGYDLEALAQSAECHVSALLG